MSKVLVLTTSEPDSLGTVEIKKVPLEQFQEVAMKNLTQFFMIFLSFRKGVVDFLKEVEFEMYPPTEKGLSEKISMHTVVLETEGMAFHVLSFPLADMDIIMQRVTKYGWNLKRGTLPLIFGGESHVIHTAARVQSIFMKDFPAEPSWVFPLDFDPATPFEEQNFGTIEGGPLEVPELRVPSNPG